MRRLLRWLVNGLCLLSLLACSAAASLWVQSHRQRYLLAYDRVDDLPTEWLPSGWRVSLEPSCVYVGHATRPPVSKSDVLPGPMGEVRILVRDRPPTGLRWAAEAPAPRWDGAFNRRDLRWEML